MRSANRVAYLAAAGTVVLWAAAFPAIAVAVAGLGVLGLSVLRLFVAPVFAGLLAAGFLGERRSRIQWAGNGLALAGVAVIACSHGVSFGAASLVVLAAAVAQATFHVAEKPLLVRYSGFEVTAYAMWAGTVLLLPWSAPAIEAVSRAPAGAVRAAVFLGVAPSALGFALWARALARMPVGRATAWLYLVPAVVIVVSLVWLSQLPSPVSLAGGALAVGGVVLSGAGRVVGVERKACGLLGD